MNYYNRYAANVDQGGPERDTTEDWPEDYVQDVVPAEANTPEAAAEQAALALVDEGDAVEAAVAAQWAEEEEEEEEKQKDKKVKNGRLGQKEKKEENGRLGQKDKNGSRGHHGGQSKCLPFPTLCRIPSGNLSYLSTRSHGNNL